MTYTFAAPIIIPRKRIATALLSLSLVLFALYMYFLCASVMHVVMRSQAVSESGDLRSEISSLEGKYIAAQYQVSNAIASLDGYHSIEKKIFIDRSTQNLAMNDTMLSQ